ncbi:hypothetical protein PT015_23235 [Candidatus Mycobacterium wuenschmannii]|uniref:Uncharacterized protein n=1 Tax=Candidatus Mycobacterium wuenschmannii TaxID=3027808 RepID=A0ABY8VVM0_9MYCO|nr:hypothetical protein [Candidatus Mycobacterium wuenschmannii]WIM87708.1 hypothetical protein PT015_23235 [Candidatus Mycobacterium wuenschmannii]
MAGISQAERDYRDRLYQRGLKQCTTYKEPLTLDKFTLRPDGWRGLNGSCRPCCNARTANHQNRTPDYQAYRQRRWRHANPVAWLAISRRRDVRQRWRRGEVLV